MINLDEVILNSELRKEREKVKILREALEEISDRDIDNIAGESALIADSALAKIEEME